MAFRSQAGITGLMLVAVVASAADYPVKHLKIGRDEVGLLSIGPEGIKYVSTPEKKHRHYQWSWNDVQRLKLADDQLEIVTYKDVQWQAGRDRRFNFKGHDFGKSYELLREHLPRRFVPRIARTDFQPSASYPAKRIDGLGGQEGTLLIGADRFVFKADGTEGSQTWVLADVDNVSSSDPMEFTIASLGSEYRFQLKRPMPESSYNELWRKLNTRSHP